MISLLSQLLFYILPAKVYVPFYVYTMSLKVSGRFGLGMAKVCHRGYATIYAYASSHWATVSMCTEAGESHP